MKLYVIGKATQVKMDVFKSLATDHSLFSSDPSTTSQVLDHGCSQNDLLWAIENRLTFRDRVFEQMQTSDACIAYLDTPDSYGSIVEIVYATEVLKKEVTVFLVDPAYKFNTGYINDNYSPITDAYWLTLSHELIDLYIFNSKQEVVDYLVGVDPPWGAAAQKDKKYIPRYYYGHYIETPDVTTYFKKDNLFTGKINIITVDNLTGKTDCNIVSALPITAVRDPNGDNYLRAAGF